MSRTRPAETFVENLCDSCATIVLPKLVGTPPTPSHGFRERCARCRRTKTVRTYRGKQIGREMRERQAEMAFFHEFMWPDDWWDANLVPLPVSERKCPWCRVPIRVEQRAYAILGIDIGTFEAHMCPRCHEVNFHDSLDAIRAAARRRRRWKGRLRSASQLLKGTPRLDPVFTRPWPPVRRRA